jgi:phosphoglycerol transferase MdoB-like AlkP superfamily enzyme
VTQPTPQTWRRYAGPFLPGLTGTLLVAVLCNLVLELVQLTDTGGYPWRFKSLAFPSMFVLGSLVLWLLVGLVHAVVGRLWVTTALMATATVVVAVADHEKVRLLHEPVYPSDWAFVGDLSFLSEIVGRRVVVLLVVAVLVIALAAFLGARALGRRLAARAGPPQPQPPPRTRVLVRILTGALCLLGIGYLGGFNDPGNAVRETYDVLGAKWRPWSQQRNYLGNGFVGGFLYNLPVPAMVRPADYSRAEMARITERYTAAADRINRHRDPQGLRDVNVVMVLSESFSDPTALAGVHVPEDPIPFTRRLMASTTSGAMLAQNIGGGTANMEFEALTGMSMSQLPPQLRVPYQSLIPRFATFPSAVEWLKREGHRAIAIHPFTPEMYRRREVYQALGFDEFVHDDTMHEQDTSGHDGYISDQAAFDEVRRRIDGSADPLLVHLVTMQNHIPFPDRYDDPAHVTGPDGERLSQTGQYVRGISHTDVALTEFIGRLERSDERTVVVFYGDHLPATYPDSVFQANGKRRMHQTPFFVWANFAGHDARQPTTSPIHFMDLMLQRTGTAVPPYYALLQRLREQLPAMDSGMYVNGSDRLVPRRDLPARVVRLLHDYRLVQYDLSAGKRYSEDVMLGPTG